MGCPWDGVGQGVPIWVPGAEEEGWLTSHLLQDGVLGQGWGEARFLVIQKCPCRPCPHC